MIKFKKNIDLFLTVYGHFQFQILDSERSEGSSGFTIMVLIFFFILYTKFLPERVFRFQHKVTYNLAN